MTYQDGGSILPSKAYHYTQDSILSFIHYVPLLFQMMITILMLVFLWMWHSLLPHQIDVATEVSKTKTILSHTYCTTFSEQTTIFQCHHMPM